MNATLKVLQQQQQEGERQRELSHRVPRSQAVADSLPTEEERVAAFLHELAGHEGYNTTVTPQRGTINEHSSGAQREAQTTRLFKDAVRVMLKKHGLIFS